MRTNPSTKRSIIFLASGIGLFLSSTPSLHAQFPGLNQAEVKVSATFSGKSEIEGLGSAFSSSQWKLSTPLFYKKGDAFLLAGTFGYTLTNLEFNKSISGMNIDSLHEFQASLVAMLEINEKWKSLIMVAPSHASDLEDFDGDGMSYFSILAALYQVNPNLGLVLGAFQSTGYDEDRILPALGLRWTPSEKMELLIAGPQVSFLYKPSQNSSYSIFSGIQGTRWNTVSGGDESDLRLRGFFAGLGLERKITGNINFSLDVGAQFLRELEIRNSAGAILLDKDVKEEPFIRTGLSYRF